MYDQSTVLGAVSQDGGVPTGGVFHGNASVAAPAGSWFERTAAGFMTCHATLTSSTSADTTWTYASAFLGGTTPALSIQPIGANLRVDVVSRNETACVFSIRDLTTGARVAVPADLIARGRWSNMT